MTFVFINSFIVLFNGSIKEDWIGDVLSLHGQILVVEGYRGGFFDELLEASTMSGRANHW